jgi:hypothetical protein
MVIMVVEHSVNAWRFSCPLFPFCTLPATLCRLYPSISSHTTKLRTAYESFHARLAPSTPMHRSNHKPLHVSLCGHNIKCCKSLHTLHTPILYVNSPLSLSSAQAAQPRTWFHAGFVRTADAVPHQVLHQHTFTHAAVRLQNNGIYEIQTSDQLPTR